MMMAPAQYVEQFENASYQEILKVKNELILRFQSLNTIMTWKILIGISVQNRMFVIRGI